MKRINTNPKFIKFRAVAGGFYMLCGAIVVAQIVHAVGIRMEAAPGIALGLAMMALGAIRIRDARRLRNSTP